MIKLDRETVEHWCPKVGNVIICDTSRSKSCVHCMFAVHRLVVANPKFVQYVIPAHVISILFLIYYIFVQGNFLVPVSFSVFSVNFGFYAFTKYKMLGRKHNCLIAQVQELRNWANRNHR